MHPIPTWRVSCRMLNLIRRKDRSSEVDATVQPREVESRAHALAALSNDEGGLQQAKVVQQSPQHALLNNSLPTQFQFAQPTTLAQPTANTEKLLSCKNCLLGHPY